MINYIKLLTNNKNYIFYLIARIISKFGDIFYTISVMWYIYDKTKSATAVGFVLLFSNLPQIFIGLIAGVFVDKSNRKVILILSDFARCGLILILLFVFKTDNVNILMILLCSFMLESFDILFSTSVSTILPKIVKPEDIVTANALNNVVFQVIEVAGFAICGFVIANIDISMVFILNALTFLISGIIFLVMKKDIFVVENSNDKINIYEDITFGIKYLLKDKFLVIFMLVLILSNVATGIIATLPPILSKVYLNLGADGVGIINTTISVGMIIGTFVIGAFTIRNPGKYFVVGMFLGGFALSFIGYQNNIYTILVLYFIYGLSDSFTIPIYSFIQVHIADNVRGRIFSLINVVVLSLSPIAMGASGILTDLIGIKLTYMLSGVIFIVAALTGLLGKTFRDAKISNRTIDAA